MVTVAVEPGRPSRPDAAGVAAPPQPRERELAPPEARPADPFAQVTRLQQSLGNQAVQARLQPKLIVGPSGDRYEQEADRVADQILRERPASQPAIQLLPPARPTLAQRDCAGCDDEEAVQRKPLTADPADLATPEPNIARSGGRPLPAATRAYFEQRIGHDFGDVRLHTDGQAAASARAVRAHAYTVGTDIAFAAGQFAPETTAGRRLLAHELTHVVQQSGRTSAARPTLASSAESADTLIPPAVTPAPELRLQRQDDEEPEPAEVPLTRDEEIELSQTSAGEITAATEPPVITLYNFAINSAKLKARHREALREVAAILKKASGSDLRVLILGHADDTGAPRVNDPLSQRRANAVQRAIKGAGVPITAAGAGEYDPADTNDTVEGRSRNRRVDIYILPDRPPPPKDEDPPPENVDPPPPTVDPPPTVEPPPEVNPPPDVDPWFCEQYPIICAAIGLGSLGGLGIWYCITHPWACIPIPPFWRRRKKDEEEPPKEKEPEKKKPPEPHACVVPGSVDLPSGTLTATPRGPFFDGTYALKEFFEMNMSFLEDPTTGCVANMGEYHQQLTGYAERDEATGTMRRERIRLVDGYLHPTTPLEDARQGLSGYPYGHRYWDDLSESHLRSNDPRDKFTPTRERGPDYYGEDEPGMESELPGEHLRFKFDFEGVPVERKGGVRTPLETPHKWTVKGDFTLPTPPTPTPPTTPTTPPTTPTPTDPVPDDGGMLGMVRRPMRGRDGQV